MSVLRRRCGVGKGSWVPLVAFCHSSGNPGRRAGCSELHHAQISVSLRFTSAEVAYEDLRAFVVGKPIKSLKQHRNLGKAIDLGNRIVRKEITFIEASKQWSQLSRPSTHSPKKSRSKSTSIEKKDSSKLNKQTSRTKLGQKEPGKESRMKQITERIEEKGSSRKKSKNSEVLEPSPDLIEHRSEPNFPTKLAHRSQKESTSKNKEYKELATGGKAVRIEPRRKKSTEKEKPTKGNLMKSHPLPTKEKNPPNKQPLEACSYSTESEILQASLNTKTKTVSQSKFKLSQKADSTIGKTKKLATDLSVPSYRENEPKSLKKTKKPNLTIEPFNYPALSVLEETPREMTPIKSPRMDGPRSDMKTKSRKSFKEKQSSEKPQSNQKTLTKKQKDVCKSIIKKSIRKASGATRDKLTAHKDSDNSSYNTEVFEQMYDQLLSKEEIKDAIQLKDIIPLRATSKTHSTITASSTPVEPCNDFGKKEFFIDDSHQQLNEESELLEESMLLLSNDQRSHIRRSDAELERCMKEFQAVEQIYNLHQSIPKNQVDLNSLFSKLVTVCKRAEIHKLPPEVLLSNNIGASINTIKQIVKKISHLIPEEHKDVTLILDKCVGILVRRLEEYVTLCNYSTSEEMISLKSIIFDQNQRNQTSQRGLQRFHLVFHLPKS